MYNQKLYDKDKKKDLNKWSDIKKVRYHLRHGDGFMIRKADDPSNRTGFDVVVFQGRDYLGYTWYKLTKSISKLLEKHK